jgi:acyl carrier protein
MRNMTSEKIIGYVAEQFGVDEDSLSRDTNFVDDLNADSLDVVELSMTIEDEFGLGEISEDDLKNIKTIGDLVDYVERASGN